MDMSEPEDKRLSMNQVETPVEPVGDKVYRLVSIGSQLIPVFGGAIGEAFHAFVKSPVERRQLKAIELMMDAINELYERTRRSQEDLIKDEAFVSTLFTAATLSARTADEEKLKAIKNAVISSAMMGAPNEAFQQMYMATLADMTSIHLRLLSYFKTLKFDNVQRFNTGDRAIQDGYFEMVRPFLQEGTQRGFVERATLDLRSWGVIAIPEGRATTLRGPDFIVMMLTDFGKGLLEFINA